MPRNRCWDRPDRGGVRLDGGLSPHRVDGLRIVVAGDEVLSGVTKGKLLRRLKSGEALIEYAYPEGTDPAWARADAVLGGPNARRVAALSPPLVDGRAHARWTATQRGRGTRLDQTLAMWCDPDPALWWVYASHANSLTPSQCRQIFHSNFSFDHLHLAAPYSDPFAAALLLTAGAEPTLLDTLAAYDASLLAHAWAAARSDPHTLALAARHLDSLPSGLNALATLITRPADLAATAAGLDPSTAPAPGKALAWVLGLERASRDELRAALLDPANHARAVDALAVSLGGTVPRHYIEAVLETNGPGPLIGVSGRALVDAIEWVSGDAHVPDDDVVALALRTTQVFGRQTRVMAAKCASAGWSAHDVAASLPDLNPTQAKEFTQWLAGQDLGWADHNLARLAALRVAASWTDDASALTNRSLREADLWIRAQAMLDGPAANTPFASMAAAVRATKAEATEALGYWGGSLVTPRFAPAVTVTSQDGKFSGQFLDRSDPRGMFLGELTDCCQQLGEAGASAAIHGQIVSSGQFFVVQDARGTVIAQSWAWLDDHGGVCFDNIELVESDGHQTRRPGVREVYAAMGAELIAHGAPLVTIGLGYTDGDLLDGLERAEDHDSLSPAEYHLVNTSYTDADDQVILATARSAAARDPGSLAYPRCRPTQQPDTLMWVDGPDSWEVSGLLADGRRALQVGGTAPPTQAVLDAISRPHPGVEIRTDDGTVLVPGTDQLDPGTLAWLGEHARAGQVRPAQLALYAQGVNAELLLADGSTPPDYANAMDPDFIFEVRDYQAVGVNDYTTMEALRNISLGADDVASYARLGITDLDDVRALHDEAVTYLLLDRNLHNPTGLDVGPLTPDQLRALRVVADEINGYTDTQEARYDAGGAQLASYIQAGFTDPDQVRAALAVGISSDDARGYARVGIAGLEAMQTLSATGLRGRTVAGYATAGVTDLDDIRRLQSAKVISGAVYDYTNAGVESVDDMVALATHGITAHDATGYADIDMHGDLAAMRATHDKGLTGSNVADFRDANVFDMETMFDLTARGLTGTTCLAYHDAGIRDTADMERLVSAGVDLEEVVIYMDWDVNSLDTMITYHDRGVTMERLADNNFDLDATLAELGLASLPTTQPATDDIDFDIDFDALERNAASRR